MRGNSASCYIELGDLGAKNDAKNLMGIHSTVCKLGAL